MKDKVTREQLEEARKYLAKFNTKNNDITRSRISRDN